MKINVVHDCTQRELINDITRIIAKGIGYAIGDKIEVTESPHPRTARYTQIAIDIFETVVGSTPSYADDPVNPLSNSRYFQVISYDPFDREGDIVPIARHKYVEGVQPLGLDVDTCFADLISGDYKFTRQYSYATDPADPIYIYLVDSPYAFGRHSYFAIANFDVTSYQVRLGLKPTVQP